ncbi:MAG: helix-turn-helix transcriptional regulator [Solirubrobacterales bacterium]|nr:helix-turn-helix transcriptional regulator [Solirubrobacterales bacterium]
MFQRRGTIPILLLLNETTGLRFTAIVESLPTIHRTVIAERLTELRELTLIVRQVEEGPPIATNYYLSPLGGELALAAVQLDKVARSDFIPGAGQPA